MFKRIASMVLAAGLAVSTAFTALPVQAATYTNELTGEPADTAIQAQRPIAVMVDNDPRALPHYNVADADIVYELVNSTANNRITRLMAVYKTWNAIGQVGNIRSTRPTNILVADELNAVLIHDGGPYHNNAYFASTAIAHLSGNFSRYKNGKASEFTEYLSGANEYIRRAAAAGISTNYTRATGNHFNFAPYGTTVDLAATYAAPAATKLSLPFPKTTSQLVYNAASGMYDYYEYGTQETDADGQHMSFRNVFVQCVDMNQLDKNGYMIFNCIGFGAGYYLTGGHVIPVTWVKASSSSRTVYLNAAGQEIQVNTGKSYVTMVPTDSWGLVTLN